MAQTVSVPPQGVGQKPQPLEALQLADALLRIATVSKVTGLSPATIYRKLAHSAFPKPVRLSARCTRWRAGDVRAWLVAQVEARDAT